MPHETQLIYRPQSRRSCRPRPDRRPASKRRNPRAVLAPPCAWTCRRCAFMRISSCEIDLADLAQAFGGIAKILLGGAGRGRQSARRWAVSSGGQRPGDGDGERRPNANRHEMIHLRDGVREAAEQFPAMRSGMRLRRSRNEKRADRQKVSQLMTHGSSLPVHPRRRMARVSHRRCHGPATVPRHLSRCRE